MLLLPLALRERLTAEWIERVGEFAALVWRGDPTMVSEDELENHESIAVGGTVSDNGAGLREERA